MGKNEALWRSRDRSFNDGRWQYILCDTEYSSGTYGFETTSAGTDHLRMALEGHPLFASAIRNPSFQKLFLDALRSIGTESLSYESVDAALETYAAQWKPLIEDYYLRFGDTSEDWDESLQFTRDFFRDRCTNIITMAEADLEELQAD